MEKLKTNAIRILDKAGISYNIYTYDHGTVLDSSCKVLDKLIVSAGKLGHQIELAPNDLIKLIHYRIESIIVRKNI